MPKHRSFYTREEAEAFVNDPNWEAQSKSTSKSKKTRAAAQAPEADEIDESIPAGTGLLPKGAVDGFDPRIQLNPATRTVEYKSEEKLRASKMMATGTSKSAPIVIYTDGSSTHNGTAQARAGIGVHFGPDDPRYAKPFRSLPLEGIRLTCPLGMCLSD